MRQALVTASSANVLADSNGKSSFLTEGYGSFSIQLTNVGTGNTVVVEGSDDGNAWSPLTGFITSTNGASLPQQTFNTAGVVMGFACTTAYVRMRVQAYGSGTVTSAIVFKATPLSTQPLSPSSVAFSEVITVPFAASATFVGLTRDSGTALGVSSVWAYINACCYSSSGGMLKIEIGDDGIGWAPLLIVGVTAGVASIQRVPIFARYYRVSYINGATAATTLILRSSLSAA